MVSQILIKNNILNYVDIKKIKEIIFKLKEE